MGFRESIGGIQPFAEISRGPMTVVYRGYDPSLDRFVLLKLLRPEFSGDAVIRDTFANEARLLAKVRHPNVVSVFSSGMDHDTAYLVTEFVEGVSLAELLTRSLPPPVLAAYIIAHVCSGLGAAHAAGILHRDLKPANILVSHAGEVKITDFGLAIATDVDARFQQSEDDQGATRPGRRQPSIAGTLGFLAPEVVNGKPPTEASDLFSCGATLYQMLTGQPAFAGDSDGEVIDATLNRNPMLGVEDFSSAPAGLLVLCGRLLRKDPAQRISKCSDLTEAVDRWLGLSDTLPDATDLSVFLSDPESYRPTRNEEIVSQPAIQTHPNRPRVYRWTAAAVLGVLLIVAAGLISRSTGVSDLPLEPVPDIVGPAARMPASNPNGKKPADREVASDVAGQRSLRGNANGGREAVRAPDDIEMLAKPGGTDDVAPVRVVVPTEITSQEETGDNANDSGIRRAATGGGANDYSDNPAIEAPGSTAFDPEAAPTGTVTVQSVPWASLWVDGNPYGSSFPDTIALARGSHEIVLRNPEFPDFAHTISVVPGQHQIVTVSLWSFVARLNLTVVPWAIVEIDGMVLDTIPPQVRPFILSPGTHRLRLSHPEFGQITRDVVLEAGETRSLAYNLRETSAE